mmetsp:Transcript_2132/g.3083  ORF Transcript_2132/g.3083 Transcript_2132/m.3083 type:complete len:455 (+) Transcript_2132:28-1392(+)
MEKPIDTLMNMGIDKDTAQTLLLINNNDVSMAINMFLESQAYEPPKKVEPPKDTCVFCKTHKNDCISDVVKFPGCSHDACVDCLKSTCDALVAKQKSPFGLQCPHCNQTPTWSFIEKYCTPKTRKAIDRLFLSTIPKTTPSTTLSETTIPFQLADFDLAFTNKDTLRRIHEDLPYLYFTERHYAAVGDAVQRAIQQRMIQTYNMKEHFVDVPMNDVATHKETQYVNIFTSPNYEKKKQLLLLIQGSGQIRPGMWARKLCLNDTLHTGSQLPYIEQAYKRDWGVIILNPNMNRRRRQVDKTRFDFYNPSKGMSLKKEDTIDILGHENGREHVKTVWQGFVESAKAEKIAIVCHSAGGWATAELCRNPSILKRLTTVVFQDSLTNATKRDPLHFVTFLRQHCAAFNKSSQPLGTLLRQPTNTGCIIYSAGTRDHDACPGMSVSKTFEWIESRFLYK